MNNLTSFLKENNDQFVNDEHSVFNKFKSAQQKLTPLLQIQHFRDKNEALLKNSQVFKRNVQLIIAKLKDNNLIQVLSFASTSINWESIQNHKQRFPLIAAEKRGWRIKPSPETFRILTTLEQALEKVHNISAKIEYYQSELESTKQNIYNTGFNKLRAEAHQFTLPKLLWPKKITVGRFTAPVEYASKETNEPSLPYVGHPALWDNWPSQCKMIYVFAAELLEKYGYAPLSEAYGYTYEWSVSPPEMIVVNKDRTAMLRFTRGGGIAMIVGGTSQLIDDIVPSFIKLDKKLAAK